jgi:hypothetical protein
MRVGMMDIVSGTTDSMGAFIHDSVFDENFLSNTLNLTYEHSDLLMPGVMSVIMSSLRKTLKKLDGGDGPIKNILVNIPVGMFQGIRQAALPMRDYYWRDGWEKWGKEVGKQTVAGMALLVSFLSGASIAGVAAMATVKKLWIFMSDLHNYEEKGRKTLLHNLFDPTEDYRLVSGEERAKKIQERYIQSEVSLLKESREFMKKEWKRREKRTTTETETLADALSEINERRKEKLKPNGVNINLDSFESNTYKRHFRAVQENWPGIHVQINYIKGFITNESPQNAVKAFFEVLSRMNIEDLSDNPTRRDVTSKFTEIHNAFKTLTANITTPKSARKTAEKIVALKLADETEEFTKEKAFQCVRLLYRFIYVDCKRKKEEQLILDLGIQVRFLGGVISCLKDPFQRKVLQSSLQVFSQLLVEVNESGMLEDYEERMKILRCLQREIFKFKEQIQILEEAISHLEDPIQQIIRKSSLQVFSQILIEMTLPNAAENVQEEIVLLERLQTKMLTFKEQIEHLPKMRS